MIFAIRSPENNEDPKMFLIEGVIDWLPHTSFQLISFY